MKQRLFLFLLAILIVLLGTSCMRSQSKGVTSDAFVPPTLIATSVKTPTVDPFRPTEDLRGPCDDQLNFVDDVTVPDGTVFAPGEEIIKTWKVKNAGTCEWLSKYTVRQLSGSSMGAEQKQKLRPIAPGETGEITIKFTAPETPGNYFSQWQAYNAQGKSFGQDFFLDIVVQAEETTP